MRRKKRKPSLAMSAPQDPENGDVRWLTVVGARHNNLKDITVDIPLGRFVCVTGVSGSGKSSLINDIVRETLRRDLNDSEKVHPGDHDRIVGQKHLDKIVDINQSPIGRTPRSNPATYIKVFDEIRRLYAQLPDSKVRGYKPGRFSFNVQTGPKGGGRCDACEGNGANKIEMDFLADIWVSCPVCASRRFNRETLQILFKGKSIADVLDMDVTEAMAHFSHIPKIAAMLTTLHDVGLDYIKLGQSSTTLSGGEAQRIKLARELVKKATGRTLYLLDEPTTGLHFDDIKKLLNVLHGFVDAGNSVIVIEHNLDVVKTADWIIDLGPEGGDRGGRVVAQGTPEQVAKVAYSYTGQALKPVLDPRYHHRRSGKKAAHRRNRTGRASASELQKISVIGAKQHNLKNITVDIPRGKTTVFSGPSGSGKSSLAIDTIYAEGQRRYVESLSAYARQFLGRLQKPRVDHIYGLSPAISIEQKTAGKSPRSTVGTVTEIYDYMRVLWARVGKPYCPKCHVPIGTQTTDEIVDRILEMGDGTRALLLSPVERGDNESYSRLFQRQQSNGFTRVRVDGEIHALDGSMTVDERRRHSIEIVVDRIIVSKRQRSRISDSVEQALALGNGVVKLQPVGMVPHSSQREGCGTDGVPKPLLDREPVPHACPTVKDGAPVRGAPFLETPRVGDRRCSETSLRSGTCPPPLSYGQGWGTGAAGNDYRFSQLHSCRQCGLSYDELTPHHFSFNTRMGWCPSCEGLGVQRGASPDAIALHPTRSLLDGALAGWEDARRNTTMAAVLAALAHHIGFDPETPWCELDEGHRLAVLQGCGDAWITLPSAATPDGHWASETDQPPLHPGWKNLRFRWRGYFPAIDRATRSSWTYRKRLENIVSEVPCTGCGGSRLRAESRCVELGHKTIEQVTRMTLEVAMKFFANLKLERREKKIAGELLHEITSRLRFLLDVGLDYLTLHRPAPTLSGGESQRIRLASQIGSGLTGVLYCLDEPTIGLHPRDNARLIGALAKLRDLGNSLIIIEHDREVIDHADHVLDFGPGAGSHGGTIVAAASPEKLRTRRASRTGRYLAGTASIPIPSNRREVRDRRDQPIPDRWLRVYGARHNNLKEIDVALPLGRFIVVTGVSGSGKSSLVTDTLYNALASRIHRARLLPGAHDDIEGAEQIDKVINVDQSPIGNSPSSNPATYTGLFDGVRELYAKLPDSKIRGYTANRFSFNRPGGRCEACEGNGRQRIEMHFLPDVWIECESCHGSRYVRETLEVKYKGKSIADVLNMPIRVARRHFDAIPKIRRMLEMIDDVGLGYIQLGQPAPTLSGGEAQRVKLAAELGRPSTGKTLYILDEPTTGLHFDDLGKLLGVLHRLVDLGNTVVCIEHNLDVIKTADHVIDLGPEASTKGGSVVVTGTPEQVAQHPKSHTGVALAPVLKAGPYRVRQVFDSSEQAGIERELARGIKLDTAGIETKMPWQIDGKKWHTVNHLDRHGKPVQWDPNVVLWFVKTVERVRGLAPADWNDRARIEIKAPGTDTMWFGHILTGGRELIDITIRVPARCFDNKTVVRRLNIKTLDEREDLPIYGSWPRVRLRASSREYDDIRIYLRDFKDVHKTAWRSLLTEAAGAYLNKVQEIRTDPIKGQPWKADGRKWHLSQKSINAHHRIKWPPSLLLELMGRINKINPSIEFDWTGKVSVAMKPKDRRKTVGRIVTNLSAGLRCELLVPKNRFTPLEIERLGTSPTVRPRSDRDLITFWLTSIKHNDAAQLANVLNSVSAATLESRSA